MVDVLLLLLLLRVAEADDPGRCSSNADCNFPVCAGCRCDRRQYGVKGLCSCEHGTYTLPGRFVAGLVDPPSSQGSAAHIARCRFTTAMWYAGATRTATIRECQKLLVLGNNGAPPLTRRTCSTCRCNADVDRCICNAPIFLRGNIHSLVNDYTNEIYTEGGHCKSAQQMKHHANSSFSLQKITHARHRTPAPIPRTPGLTKAKKHATRAAGAAGAAGAAPPGAAPPRTHQPTPAPTPRPIVPLGFWQQHQCPELFRVPAALQEATVLLESSGATQSATQSANTATQSAALAGKKVALQLSSAAQVGATATASAIITAAAASAAAAATTTTHQSLTQPASQPTTHPPTHPPTQPPNHNTRRDAAY
jgi:hypothetical protein